MTDAAELNRPLKILNNQVRGFGGREIERLHGLADPKDTPTGAESWIGSTNRIDFPPEDDPDRGCSKIELPDGSKEYLYKLLNSYSDTLLGEEHVRINGIGTGVLVKLIDAANGYNLQCHPTREWAKKMWDQEHGKSESWYVISVRDGMDEPPHILLGFKEGANLADFEAAYRKADKDAMEVMCHKVEVKPGDSFFIASGVPHKLGKGILVVEVQEPQDITMLWMNYKTVQERFHVRPAPTEEEYDKRLLGSYIFEGRSYEANLDKWMSHKELLRRGEWGSESIVVGSKQTSFFSFTELLLKGSVGITHTGFPTVAIVIDGEGRFVWDGGYAEIKKGDEWFIPYNVPSLRAEGEMQVILCNPEGAIIGNK